MAGRKKTKADDVSARYNKPFAQRLRALIGESGKSHAEIAQHFGVSRQGVGKWANGETTPDIETIVNIAEYFGISTDYLLGRTEIKSPDTTLQAVCEYTGLSENAINRIVKGDCDPEYGLGFEEKFYNIVNQILENDYFYYMASALVTVYYGDREVSDYLFCLTINDIINAATSLGINPIYLSDYIDDFRHSHYKSLNFAEFYDDVDLALFKATRAFEKLRDSFDVRPFFNDFTTEKWLEYLKMDDNTLQDLRKKSEEINNECNRKQVTKWQA